ncbi:Type 1 glutamine amidotransferase-like domain-containing protein [Carnobacterium inhibens]|uniref:Type 1 glutamine amidotransferase-like domain-containing protein n=1 Tax=Carnobacterium inhibens TaxID=147709 RepID=UPI00203EF2A4|nr:Type 1 glutamine amidotransferase-like domain-containing protein [Carnobacterium inhibens]MCM3511525.1 Type 1 glutamine amidotransferase-like domain-containing protein [Carnobacterium inhibens]
MVKMFLTSSFIDVVEQFREFVKEDLNGKTVTFIPTASIPEEIDHYVYSAKEVFTNLGIVVEELDISTASLEEIKEKLEQNNFIYVSGGNTFYLLQELRRSGADKIIIKQVEQGKLYIGESAGTVVTSPNINYINLIDDKEKAPDLDTFEGLNLINFYPVPHYNNEPFKKVVADLITQYDSNLNIVPFSNSEVIRVSQNSIDIS